MDSRTIVALQEREEDWTDELLAAAWDRITSGWTQGAMQIEVTQPTPDASAAKFCLVGAIVAAARESHADVITRAYALRRLSEALGKDPCAELADLTVVEKAGVDRTAAIAELTDNFSGLMHWNDQPRRRKEDVLGLIEKALARRLPVDRSASSPANESPPSPSKTAPSPDLLSDLCWQWRAPRSSYERGCRRSAWPTASS
jgi:hypothetical protein